jgi:F-type H+-transporting ATPase subunit alpha
MAFDLSPETVAVVMLDKTKVEVGTIARPLGRVVDVPVGESIIGRVVDPLGRPRDDRGPLDIRERREAERGAPAIMDRAPVTEPLQTGIQVIDSLIPVGRGQRELILGDRQIGKTAIALDTILNQKGKGVLCIYCAIGQRASATARVISDLESRGAMEYTGVVVTTGEDAAAMNFIAPYAAMSMGEYFMESGKDVLIVFDDLTRHARAYREMSLLLRRPPSREAYPGDIFYIHSRLLERSTHLSEEKGGGSLTALPIIETQAQNVSAYIPTNLISITDGQIYLNPTMYQQGILPPTDVSRSVSRVGGKTQLPAYRAVAGDLRLSYSQFEELEAFARFGTRLDEETKAALERGKRVREVFKQPQYDTIPVPEQIAVLVAVNEGVFDAVSLDKMTEAKKRVRAAMRKSGNGIGEKIYAKEKLSDQDIDKIVSLSKKAVEDLRASDETDGREEDREQNGSQQSENEKKSE